MRLISDCGEFQAWIEIDHEEIEVHDVRHLLGTDMRTEGYVASQAGKVSVEHL